MQKHCKFFCNSMKNTTTQVMRANRIDTNIQPPNCHFSLFAQQTCHLAEQVSIAVFRFCFLWDKILIILLLGGRVIFKLKKRSRFQFSFLFLKKFTWLSGGTLWSQVYFENWWWMNSIHCYFEVSVFNAKHAPPFGHFSSKVRGGNV